MVVFLQPSFRSSDLTNFVASRRVTLEMPAIAKTMRSSEMTVEKIVYGRIRSMIIISETATRVQDEEAIAVKLILPKSELEFAG